MVEIDTKKSFRGNLEAGVDKKDLMKYYCIDTEQEWEKVMKTIEQTKLQENAREFRKKGKGK